VSQFDSLDESCSFDSLSPQCVYFLGQGQDSSSESIKLTHFFLRSDSKIQFYYSSENTVNFTQLV